MVLAYRIASWDPLPHGGIHSRKDALLLLLDKFLDRLFVFKQTQKQNNKAPRAGDENDVTA